MLKRGKGGHFQVAIHQQDGWLQEAVLPPHFPPLTLLPPFPAPDC